MLFISIINYCNSKATAQCIVGVHNAAIEHGIEHTFVIADHSPQCQIDQICAFLDKAILSRARFHHDPSNPGFGAGHNHNFASSNCAPSDLFLILNNDVQLTDSTLIPQLTSHCRPRALVSCVIRSSGSQAIWYAGAEINWLTGDVRIHKNLPRQESVPTDFVCGCCIMVRADDFQRLGGFDEGFFMYAEDLDLSIRAARLGFDLIVVNRILSHDVGGYSKRQYTSLYLRENTKNRLICLHRYRLGMPIFRYVFFIFKYGCARGFQLLLLSERPTEQLRAVYHGFFSGWRSRSNIQNTSIKSNLASFDGRGERTESVSAKPQVLMILPHPPNAYRPRSMSMLGDFASFADVDLIYLDHGDTSTIPTNLRRVVRIPNGLFRRLVRLGLGIVVGKPILYQYYNSPFLRHKLQEIELSKYDAVYIKRMPLHELGINHHNVVLDIPDCSAVLIKEFEKYSTGIRKFLSRLDARILVSYERKLCNSATKLLCTAPREANALRSIGVFKPIQPIVHNTNARTFAKQILKDKGKHTLSFHGKLSYLANKIALDKISNSIVPELNCDRYEFLIAGGGEIRSSIRTQPGIRFIGYVDDIYQYLRDINLSVFPVEISAGLSNKALESLGAGVPVVVTPQLALGMPNSEVILERGVFVREIPDFVATIEAYFALPVDTRQAYSDACVEYVRQLHDIGSRRLLLWNYIFPQQLYPDEIRALPKTPVVRHVERGEHAQREVGIVRLQ